jgi:2-polyprenyl-6-hydroxyphenyl methylase/3-demethylubiquinone-9 3-methyltransferase
MSLGRIVRAVLGPLAAPLAVTYRDMYIRLDDLAESLASMAPSARRVAEIGCGYGDVANELMRRLPAAEYVGVDVAHPSPGSLYAAAAPATFTRQTSTELLAEHGSTFDLVLVVDVIHHVPSELRTQLLRDAADLVAPGGILAVKDWEWRHDFWSAACWFSDYYLSGDKDVRFEVLDELRRIATPDGAGDGDWTLVSESRVPPRRQNVLLTWRRAS